MDNEPLFRKFYFFWDLEIFWDLENFYRVKFWTSKPIQLEIWEKAYNVCLVILNNFCERKIIPRPVDNEIIGLIG